MAGSLLASGLSQLCEFWCPSGLLYVISGLLAGGSPDFRIVLCCFFYSQISSMAMLVFGSPFLRFLPPYQYYGWYNVITLLSITDVAELVSRSLCLVLFVCVWLLFCWFAVFFVWFLRHSDGNLDCVLVLCQFDFCSLPSMKMDKVTALI